jgi:molybdopterin molybdotransferase
MLFLVVFKRARRVLNCGRGALLLERLSQVNSCPVKHCASSPGAALPEGADTVVLQEDVQIEGGQLEVVGPLKAGANARAAGEDMQQGAEIFQEGHQLRPEELGVMAAAGLGEVSVFKPLKVAVISTGAELRAPGQAARVDQIFDANRPMLCALLRRWGMEVVDIGIVPDEAAAVRAALDRAAARADVILTSGGVQCWG